MKEAQKFPIVENCNPSVCISGKLMKCNRIVSSVFRKHLKPYGITNSQLSTLFVITKAENPSQKLLSDKLYMDKSTVNRNLRRLMENGWVVKKKNSPIADYYKRKCAIRNCNSALGKCNGRN